MGIRYRRFKVTDVDEAKQEVWGIATCEEVDKDGEIVHYETSKPFIQAWSKEFVDATDGQSLGNVREMHANKAVGRLIALEFDDANKTVRCGSKIVDVEAFTKCLEGVYTGFSLGFAIENQWRANGHTYLTANPTEISIVDNPCVPSAHFDVVKANGVRETRKFKSSKETPMKSQESRKKFLELLGKREKGMYQVCDLAAIVQALCNFHCDVAFEARYEGDNSPIPDQVKAACESLMKTLGDLVTEESAEISEDMAKAQGDVELVAVVDDAYKGAPVEEKKVVEAEAEKKAKSEDENKDDDKDEDEDPDKKDPKDDDKENDDDPDDEKAKKAAGLTREDVTEVIKSMIPEIVKAMKAEEKPEATKAAKIGDRSNVDESNRPVAKKTVAIAKEKDNATVASKLDPKVIEERRKAILTPEFKKKAVSNPDGREGILFERILATDWDGTE